MALTRQEKTRRFWASVPFPSLLLFGAAIFFTAVAIGILMAGSSSLWHRLGWGVAFGLFFATSGLLAVRARPLAFLALLVLVGMGLISPHLPDNQGWRTLSPDIRQFFVAAACILCILLGHFFFTTFVTTSGVRSVRLTTEVGLARELHEVLVPTLALRARGYELFGRSFPSSEVGGDLLDAVERDGGLTCYVADVSGHGVPAGALMGMVKSAMRMRLRYAGGLAEILSDLNQILPDLKQDNMYVTWVGLQLFPASITFALAGHLPILHYRRATGRVERLQVTHLPLGIMPAAEFTTDTAAVAPGDVLALLTDGLTEVTNRRQQELGIEGIEAVLARSAGLEPLAAVFDAVLAAVADHGKRQDDQTLLLVRALPESGSAPASGLA